MRHETQSSSNLSLKRAIPAVFAYIALAAAVAFPAHSARPGARPVPAWEGRTLEGKPLVLGDLIGRRFVLAFITPGPDAEGLGSALRAIQDERSEFNFEIVGILAPGSGAEGRRWVEKHEYSFPVATDQPGGLAARLRLGGQPAAAMVVDAEGYVVAGQSLAAPGDDAAELVEGALRDMLRLPKAELAGTPTLGDYPAAPAFEAPPLEGGDPVTLESLRGKPLVLIFFLHTCPHCHDALGDLRDVLAGLPEASRPALYGVSMAARTAEVRAQLAELDLDFFPVLIDPKNEIREAYGATRGVPVIYFIDKEGRIRWRTDGWRSERDPILARMRLAILAGEKPPLLLHSTGYSGDEFCGTCHESQQATWQLTSHAGAFETLVRHGADSNEECVGCHVVGFGQKGGYALAKPDVQLEGVGCETCHGRGGPHLSPDHAKGGYEATCTGCHDPKHSLGFEYAAFLPKVSHAANTHLLALPEAEKRKLLADRRSIRAPLLPTEIDYVGSGACRECHASEYETWSAQPHANAHATLDAAGKADTSDCLGCHTTGYDRGGFPARGAPSEHPDLVGVGCESCHGPGANHIAPGATRRGTILSLGDKCDSCVILQICGSCHDDANDPGFEFEVQDKIDLQRHGTIEAGTGKPLVADPAKP